MSQSINHCFCHLVIREDRTTFGEFQVGCNDQTSAFIAVRDHSKEQLRALFIDRHVVPFIQNQKLAALELTHSPAIIQSTGNTTTVK
ncbi:hypothetical protein ABES23_14505 [Peribacillus frigoritolerans]